MKKIITLIAIIAISFTADAQKKRFTDNLYGNTLFGYYDGQVISIGTVKSEVEILTTKITNTPYKVVLRKKSSHPRIRFSESETEKIEQALNANAEKNIIDEYWDLGGGKRMYTKKSWDEAEYFEITTSELSLQNNREEKQYLREMEIKRLQDIAKKNKEIESDFPF